MQPHFNRKSQLLSLKSNTLIQNDSHNQDLYHSKTRRDIYDKG